MIPVSVAKLGLDSVSNTYVVVLQEQGGDRMLPIWIGRPEAESIAMQLSGEKRVRPLTHDLCHALITGLGATLRRVQVTRIQDATFYAELHLSRMGASIVVDARPSDAIAVALRLGERRARRRFAVRRTVEATPRAHAARGFWSVLPVACARREHSPPVC
ncbi:MAG: bifunctional nuclease family protein [Gemmatimonadetes bacterium]|nr:bifunctional nuclease family protein [Gemmatimonadota bacterium]